LAVEAEIMRLRGLARAIYAEKVEPFGDEFHALMRVGGCEAAWAFARTHGRDAAITEAEPFHLSADRLCERLMATPALTQAGRAAKVRVEAQAHNRNCQEAAPERRRGPQQSCA
jgi:hypothetical protein